MLGLKSVEYNELSECPGPVGGGCKGVCVEEVLLGVGLGGRMSASLVNSFAYLVRIQEMCMFDIPA